MKLISKNKLNRIKRMRAIRDDLLKTDNLGRARALLMKMPNVKGCSTGLAGNYQVRKLITLRLRGGYHYHFTGYGDMIAGVQSAGKFAYMEWLKN